MIARIIRAWRCRLAARYWLSQIAPFERTARNKFSDASRAKVVATKQRLYCEAFAASERAEACRARAGGDHEDAIAREADAEWWDERATQRHVAQVINLAEVRRHAS